MYQKLIQKFNQLSELEKNALFIYKSRLGRAINTLDNNPNEITTIYQEYKEIINNPKNLFMKLSIFQNISFNSEQEFIRSIRLIQSQLMKLTNINLPEEITVYRAISIPKDQNLFYIAPSTIISTSLNINKCSKFLIPNKNYNHYLYQINLEKDSPISICPYAIQINSITSQLTLSTNSDQEEIILLKNNYDMEIQTSTTTQLPNGETLDIIIVNAKPKINTYSNHQK